ncbi:MAG: vitamin K epoxide reductase family protein [Candidatus Micrarchaeia archaeon]
MQPASAKSLAHIKIALASIGLAVAAYLIIAEPANVASTGTGFFCPGQSSGSIINCSAVLTSKYSHVLGVPLSVLAGAWLALIIVLSLVQHRSYTLGMVSAFFSIAGVFAVAYSAFAMWSIGHVCVYCSAIDAILLILFAAGIVEARRIIGSFAKPPRA